MGAAAKHRPIRRAFLERVARPVLARVLAPFAAPLLARGVDVAALASAPPFERQDIERPSTSWRHAKNRSPSFTSCCSCSTTWRRRRRRRRRFAAAAEEVLNHELGFERLVVVAYLDDRPLFERVRPASVSTASKASAWFCRSPSSTWRSSLRLSSKWTSARVSCALFAASGSLVRIVAASSVVDVVDPKSRATHRFSLPLHRVGDRLRAFTDSVERVGRRLLAFGDRLPGLKSIRNAITQNAHA